MRKHLMWALGLAIAVGVGGIAVAANNSNTLKIAASFSPSKVSATKAQGGKLVVTMTTGATGPFVSPALRAQVFFDKDFKFTTKGIPQCNSSSLQGKGPQQAKAACGRAQVGTGSAKVAPGGMTDLIGILQDTSVLAFNGKPRGDKPVILLDTYQPDLGTVAILTGVLKPSSGKYGKVLDVAVPPMPDGSVITELGMTLQKSYTSGGKKRSFVAAKCSGNRTWDFKGTFTYQQPPGLTATSTQKCKVKSSPRSQGSSRSPSRAFTAGETSTAG